MFAKKPATELETTQPNGESLLGDKMDNYRFLKLVQEQKYEASKQLQVNSVLKKNPSALSVKKFCLFIEENQPELKKMVEDQKEQAEYTSDSEEEQEEDDEDEDGSEQEQEDDEDEDKSSSESEEQEPEKDLETVESQKEKEKVQVQVKEVEKEKEKEKPKKQKVKCEPHEWTHVCKNPHCPNKKKSQKQ